MSKVLLIVCVAILCGCGDFGEPNPSGAIKNKQTSTPFVENSGSLPEKNSYGITNVGSASVSQLKQSDSKDANVSKSEGKPDSPKHSSNTSSALTASQPESIHGPDPTGDLGKKLNPEALMRGFYVFVGLSVIVMAYVAWKSFGKRPAQVHRYGVVANREDLEMAPLDSDDGDGDEDDTTHFDISKHRLK